MHLKTRLVPGKKVHLTTIEGSTPVIRCARTLPESKKKLSEMNYSVLWMLESLCLWMNLLTGSAKCLLPKKKSGIRICIDPRPLNEALKHEHYKRPLQMMYFQNLPLQKYSLSSLAIWFKGQK